jgi:ankyrin repeat protein
MGRPIHCAAAIGSFEIVKELVKAGAKLNARDSYGQTEMYSAASSGNGDLIAFLSKSGSRGNVLDCEKGTPLHILAMYSGVSDAVRALIRVGANIDHRNGFGKTALHYAVEQNNVKVAKALIDAGANVNLKDNMGRTPLHEAYNFEAKRIAALLEKRGAKNEGPGKIEVSSEEAEKILAKLGVLKKRPAKKKKAGRRG